MDTKISIPVDIPRGISVVKEKIESKLITPYIDRSHEVHLK